MIYLDTSALVKLAHVEAHSNGLVDWLSDREDTPLVSSVLTEIELVRAVRRSAPAALPNVPPILARLYRIEIDATVRAMAAAYAEPGLRSLDAIHLATAQLIAGESRETTAESAFVTYDRRLAEAAATAGLIAVQPGVDT